MAEAKLSEGYLIALVPVLGITAIVIYRMGYYAYFGVPLDFLEIDTVKTVIVGISLGAYIFIGVTSLVWLYEFRPSDNKIRRYFDHLLAAAFFTLPTWVGDIGWNSKISWPTVMFIFFCGFVTLMMESTYLGLRKGDSKNSIWEIIQDISTVTFALCLLLLASLSGLGALNARNSTSRTFLANTNYFVVGNLGDVLIVKEYFPKSKSFDRKKTLLIAIGENQVLEDRNAPIDK